jgi:hypothetical protein
MKSLLSLVLLSSLVFANACSEAALDRLERMGQSAKSDDSSNSSDDNRSRSDDSGHHSGSDDSDHHKGRGRDDDSSKSGDDHKAAASQGLFHLEFEWETAPLQSGTDSHVAKVEFRDAQGVDMSAQLLSVKVFELVDNVENLVPQNLSYSPDDSNPAEWEVSGIKFPAPAAANHYILEIEAKVGVKTDTARLRVTAAVQ